MSMNDEHQKLIVESINDALYRLPHTMQDKVSIVPLEDAVRVEWSRAFALRISMDHTGEGVRVTSTFLESNVPFSALPDTIIDMVVTIFTILAEKNS